MKKIEMARMIADDMATKRSDVNVERYVKRLMKEMTTRELEMVINHRGLNK